MSIRHRVWLLVAALLLALPVTARPAAAAPLDDGIALYQAGEYTEALPLLLQATRSDPKSVRAWTWLGATYLKLDRVPEGTSALERAVSIDPRSAPAQFFLGTAYARAGNTQKARAAFERVRALAPGTPYAASADEWLRRLAAGGGATAPQPPPPPPPAGGPPAAPPAAVPAGTCPKPPSLPAAQAPAAIRRPNIIVEVADWDFLVAKDEMLIEGEIENLGDNDVQNVRIQVVGIGLTGRQVSQASTVLQGTLESDDFREFSIKLPTRPPAMWVRLEILEYGGRRANEGLHVLTTAVDVEDVYETVAAARVKVGARPAPAGQARAHTLCLSITDNGGFPLRSVRARVTVNGSSGARSVQQTKSSEVAVDRGGAVQVQWDQPMRLTMRIDVESVTFAPLPPVKATP